MVRLETDRHKYRFPIGAIPGSDATLSVMAMAFRVEGNPG